MTFLSYLEKAKSDGRLTEKLYLIFFHLYQSYFNTLKEAKVEGVDVDDIFKTFLDHSIEQATDPFPFPPYHQAIRAPFDLYTFGLKFMRPLLDMQKTKVFHMENVEKIQKELQAGENVVLLANHQTEVDPQLISLSLENNYEALAREMIFVAGDRVLTDPIAIPCSMGRNLLCIYSKRHIENPPERKSEKLLHNRKSMGLMRDLLSEGGKSFYVAPSGGRDRPNSQGIVEVAPFDPSSVEMVRLMAKESGRKTHFYPLALSTYELLPPPSSIESTLGEKRIAKRTFALFSFCDELDMHAFDSLEKHARREALASHIWNIVNEEYKRITL